MNDEYVAEYLRISDDDVDIGDAKKESGSITNQRSVLQYFISHHEELSKYPVKEFLDDGFSGVNFNRPGIQSLLAEVRAKRVICIVVKDLSRFGRNYIEVGDYIEQIFPFMGVRFISVSDHYDSFQNPGGIEIGFKNLIHDLYSRDLSKKIKSVKQMSQKKGVYSGGDVPYGYRRGEGRGAYQPDPAAAEVVRRIFSLAIEGQKTSQIVRYLNEQGICTPGVYKNQTGNQNYRFKNEKSNLWTPTQVREIIQNEVYIGTFVCHKNSSVRPKEMVRNDITEYIKHENDHEALVSRSDFEAAQQAIQKQGKRGKYKKDSNPHALKGKVKCGYCGYSMNLNGRIDRKMYYCRMGDSCGSHLKIEAKILETVVLEILEHLVTLHKEKVKQWESETKRCFTELGKVKEKQKVLEMKMEHCKSSRLLLYRGWKEGKITKEEYILKREEFSRQETDCRKNIQEVQIQLERLTEGMNKGMPDSELQSCYGVTELTKELADKLIERIEVYDNDRIEIQWKFQSRYDTI